MRSALRTKKNSVEEKFGAVDGVRQMNLDSMAAVHDMTVKTLKLAAAIDAAVSSLGESEVSRREIFAELEQAKLKVQGLEMELEATQAKLGAALDNVASLKAEKTATENAVVQASDVEASDVEASASAHMETQLEATKTALTETQAKMDKAAKMEELASQLESAKLVDKESADLEGKLSALQVELQSVQTALSSSMDKAAALRQKLEASEGTLRTGDLGSAKAIAETASQSTCSDLELALRTSDTDLAELKVSDGRLSAAEAAIAAVSSSHANAVEFLDQQLSTMKKALPDAERLGAAASKAHEDTDGVKVELASVSGSLSAETAKRSLLESQILLL
ncbi:hypothetical protein HDU78_009587 [Chytriomyces hyalinus]|nr:hypothetical protein HDU78_009587 [Chytriomyces hyalinus]